jgi:hypothetical protein
MQTLHSLQAAVVICSLHATCFWLASASRFGEKLRENSAARCK